ncbi:alcohol dehydrogenase-like [Saccoglossus kowalevskii]|uniref:Alcohol dehydrogenase 3, mitochondrial-like n=1 Tax=Saccoglossus kowalevskii TaxID=10224 RepID=A0ABM0MKN8_SACKO|nr:PREDICTED: alcohol dehydrogenase 3, mitochondrial-like [Saccoglossus kowalevskii]
MMKCVELVGAFPKQLAHRTDRPKPDLPPEGAIIKVWYCGMCHTDAHMWVSPCEIPVILGHEVCGEIESIGDDGANPDGLRKGDKVIVYPWIACGKCKACDKGNAEYCELKPEEQIEIGITLDGGYAEYVAVRNLMYLVPVPDAIPMEIAGTLACGMLTAYHTIQVASKEIEDILQSKDNCGILIIGAGGLGLSAVKLAKYLILSKYKNVQVMCSDINKNKLALAMDAGCDDVIHWSQDENADEWVRKTKAAFVGGGPFIVIDFTGSKDTFDVAYKSLRKHGTILCIGLHGGVVDLPLESIILNSITVKGVYVGTLSQLRELTKIVADGKIPPLPYTLHKLEEAPDLICKLKTNQITTGRAILSLKQ